MNAREAGSCAFKLASPQLKLHTNILFVLSKHHISAGIFFSFHSSPFVHAHHHENDGLLTDTSVSFELINVQM